MNRLMAYVEPEEFPTLGPFFHPLTPWEQRRCDAFRGAALLHHWYVVENRTIPGLVFLTAKPMWVRPGGVVR